MKIVTNEKTYHFKDFVNLVKLDNFLLNSFEFVEKMFNVGFDENIFDIPKEQGIDFFDKQLAIYKDMNFAQYASRVHFILLTF